MLTFLGDGGAFDYTRGNTSAYYKFGKNIVLIDVGCDVPAKIMKYNLFEGIDNCYIFITHFHGDHVGGIGSVCDIINVHNKLCDNKINCEIFYPNVENLKSILKLMNISEKDYLKINNPKKSDLVVKVFEQEHIPNSFGYLFELGGKKVYYSGDALHINEDALNLFKKGEIDYFYHEVSNKENVPHTNISEFEILIPENLKDKVYVMHLNDEALNLAISMGYNKVKLLNQEENE